MNKDEIVLASTTANGMREITQERAKQAMQEQAIAFAEWIRNNTIADGAPKLCYIKDKSRKNTAELYTLFNTNNGE
jgi:hypothetical protein